MNRPPDTESARRAQARSAVGISAAELSDQLKLGCLELNIQAGQGEREHLLAYLGLLQRWNRVYNLTAIRDPAAMLTQHLLDSLAVLPWLQAALSAEPDTPAIPIGDRPAMPPGTGPGGQAPRLLDVGSGAGLPGLVLALVWPTLEADLVEPVGKKAAFLRQSVSELGLAPRVRVHDRRVEDLMLDRAPDLAICRAFASLNDFASGIRSVITSTTRVFAMKGQADEIRAESAALSGGWRVDQVIELSVPGLAAARHLVRLAQPAQEN